MRIWNQGMECMPRENMEKLQLQRLQEAVAHAYGNSKVYRDKMDQNGIKPADIKTLEDLKFLPFTVKDDFKENYPFGMFAVPQEQLVRIHASSGTTGKLTVVGYTRKDLDSWSELIARIVTMVGVTEKDVAQVAFGYGLFTGAHGLHYGLEKVGALVVPVSSGNSEKQLMIMRDFGSTALISTPTYALYLSEVAIEHGFNPREDFKLKVGLFGGEACSEEYRKEIEKRWGILASDNYGLSELGGPGLSGECYLKQGQHIAEDFFLVEVIDPGTLRPVPPGTKGEIVVTALNREALPVIRYRTKDISSIDYSTCECGRTTARLSKMAGRTDDMMIIRGVNVFPSQIESILVGIEGLSPHYQILVYKRGFLDEIEIQVEVSDEFFSDQYRQLEAIEDRFKQQLFKVLSLTPKIKLVESNTIPRGEGKAKRVIDLRDQ